MHPKKSKISHKKVSLRSNSGSKKKKKPKFLVSKDKIKRIPKIKEKSKNKKISIKRRSGKTGENYKDKFKSLKDLSGILDGHTAFILGNAPSIDKINLKVLDNYFTIGINRVFYKYDPTVLLWQDLALWVQERNNVLESPLANPLDDSQFWNWEIPILLWAQKNIINFSEEYNKYLGPEYIPVDTKTTQTTINFPDTPKIEFISPENGSFINADIDFLLKIDSSIEIIDTKIYLNKILLGELNKIENNTYSYKIDLANLIDQNEIKIEAIDSFNQKNTASIIVFK